MKNKMIVRLTLIFYLVSLLPVYAADTSSQMPSVVVMPIKASAGISEQRQQILLTHLRSYLSKYYHLVTQEDVNTALTQVFEGEELCTEQKCIEQIQSYLQVERVCYLQIVKDDNIYQLGMTLQIETNVTVKDTICENCGTTELYDQIDGLAEKVIQRDAAIKPTGSGEVKFVPAQPGGLPTGTVVGGITPITPKVSGDTTSTSALLIIETIPAGASITLGGTKVGVSPYTQTDLQAGQTIRITLEKDKYHTQVLETKLSGGINELLNIQLKPKFGDLKITSEPTGAEITFLGEKIGTTPHLIKGIESGIYTVSVKKPLYSGVLNDRVIVEDEKETVKHYTLIPNFGVLDVASTPADAKVIVKDKNQTIVAQQEAPASFKLDPGTYTVTFEKPGYESFDYKVTVVRTKTEKIENHVLRKLEGKIMVVTTPINRNARVYVDGEQVGNIPFEGKLAIGEHNIEVKAAGQIATASVNIKDKDQQTLNLKLKAAKDDESFFGKYKWWILGGLVVAGGAAAAASSGGGGGGDNNNNDNNNNNNSPTGEIEINWE